MTEPLFPWQMHYPSDVPFSLSYPSVPLYEFLLGSAREYPNAEALFFMGKRITYEQLRNDCFRFAAALVRLGVQRGDRVAIMLPNVPQSVIAYYGTLMAGAVVVQTNPLYTERELMHQLVDAEVETIICLDLLYARVENVRNHTPLRRILVTGIPDYLPLGKRLLYPLVQRKARPPRIPYNAENCVYAFVDLLRKEYPDFTPVSVTSDDLAVLQYTGGTTGVAKGVMLTHANLVANVLQCRAWFSRSRLAGERFLGAVPFFHVYGMTVVMNFATHLAASIILVPRFEVSQILKLVDKQKPTVFPGAPTMYVGLLNHPDARAYDLSSIQACISGSAPLPIEVQQAFERLTNGKLVEGYGLTECSPVTHANPIWGRQVIGSIGVPWPDTECRIVDLETGEECMPGEIGELCIRGPQVMKGYWKREEETKASFQDGWFRTGDIARMDEAGYFYIVDRKKDIIIAGGFNIYPREVEEVLYEHPAVREAAVVGIPDAYRGETVKAFVVVREDQLLTEADLNQFCRERLAAFKVPHVYEFRTDLPKTAVGKILRRTLAEEAKEEE
ncbi:long-chain-fatty-acid--CoA ligase [Aneurinibacillus uraniidurans]|uniref:long-chain-fatty-acid--CoA ligase n=1 Tax=Aneurinibacillus uraniidurans TaxID=2966586 RepID=UPI00234A2C73|nr:long-chain fatty acid--CoA ligase [Aneurinibacillus sp. B1]WCN38494.1 long-chain fatty acid--CoA ligase [Aneurinibacillus sp. B1]